MVPEFLRYHKRLTGTKVVCAEGDCGACTVLLFHPKSKRPDVPIAVNACILLVAQLDGTSVVTIEALQDQDLNTQRPKLTEVQSCMVSCHGSQCGFCTPGFVMAMTGLVEKKLNQNNADPISKVEAKNALTGNLCRCTGYEPILDAAKAINLKACAKLQKRFFIKSHQVALTQSLKEPLSLIECKNDELDSNHHTGSELFQFEAPIQISDAAAFLDQHQRASNTPSKDKIRILAGGSDLGVARNKGKLDYGKILSLQGIDELTTIKRVGARRLWVGARVTLSELRRAVKTSAPEISQFLNVFASPQIKNTATLVGNLCNASPIADCIAFLMVTQTIVHIHGSKGVRNIPITDFIKGYRDIDLSPNEFVTAVSFELPDADESFELRKVSQRKDLDISAVNTAFRVKWVPKKSIIESCYFALGGVAAVPLRLKKTEAFMTSKDATAELIEQAISILHQEMTPLTDLRASMAYRRVVAENLFLKFWSTHVANKNIQIEPRQDHLALQTEGNC